MVRYGVRLRKAVRVAGNSTARGRSVTNKVAVILSAFTKGSVHSLSEIAAEADLPLPTAHRLVSELTACQLLDRTADGRYRVGKLIYDVGSSCQVEPTVEERGSFILQDLSIVTDTGVRLGRLDTDTMMVAYIEKEPGSRAVTDFSPAARLPAHACA
jgi:DNA-binding IclR family transcriptional regulator